MAKAVALLSGGLDSMLAIRLLLGQGVAVEALHFVSVFDCGATDAENCASSQRAAAQLGVPLRFEEISAELLEIVKNPKHGRGSNMNPCIDCHAMMVRRAARVMREIGADFLCTGEVLGERPMSQRRDALGIVERDAGAEGLLLRPLSAQLLEPTIPEQKGWVDRAKLLRISGRCRKPQFELAKALNLGPFPTPAGGCLLTDPGFSARMRDLLKHQPDCTPDDVRLLKFGRHFRLSPAVRAVIGRNEGENHMIEELARAGDVLMEAAAPFRPAGAGARTRLRGGTGPGRVHDASLRKGGKTPERRRARLEIRRASGRGAAHRSAAGLRRNPRPPAHRRARGKREARCRRVIRPRSGWHWDITRSASISSAASAARCTR